MSEKYTRVQDALSAGQTPSMKVFGHSMTPIIKSGTLLTFQRFDEYEVGDIVFCRCKGKFIDAHKITKKDNGRYMISNNHGWDNGWTRTIYGKVIKIG